MEAERLPAGDDYRQFFTGHPQPMWIVDVATLEFLDVNAAATEKYGYTRAEFLSMTLADIRPPEDREFLRNYVRNLGYETSRSTLWRHLRNDGSTVYVDIVMSPIVFEGRDARIVLASDASSRLATSEALTQSRTALAEAQELAHLGSWDQDLERGDIMWSPELYRILGVDPTEGDARLLWEFDHPDDAELVREEVLRAKRERRPWTVDHRVVRPDGAVRYVHERGRLSYDAEGRPERIVGAMLDITDRKLAEQRLQYLAEHDVLTDLPNRALLARRLVDSIERARRNERIVAVLFLDLDRFKAINDTIGHAAGDKLLATLARRLSGSLGDRDTVGRPGGDEFIIVLDDLDSIEQADALAARLLDVVSVPLPYRDTRIILGASVGIAIAPRDGSTADDLLRSADAAMYAAKKRGGNSIEHFRPELQRAVIEELNLERALRFALERNAIELAFQPIVSARSGRPVALEALARWSERGRYIDPGDFIRLAEQTGLIARLGNFVLERACLQMQRLIDVGYGRLSMAVNISARQFRDAGFVESVRATLARTKLEPERLVLEITESAYIDSADATLDAMNELSAMGVRLALDDFGTGYSALGYLKRLPVDEIKIDRSFVENVTTDSADESIVRAIVGVAKNLDLTVVAEGVETAEQAAFLLGLGCNRFQGFHFARPLAPDDLDAYLAASELG